MEGDSQVAVAVLSMILESAVVEESFLRLWASAKQSQISHSCHVM